MHLRPHSLLATAAAGTVGVLALAASASGALASQRYALVVGVTEYPSLDERLWLAGPANDAVLMEQVLLQQGFTGDHITVLSQGANSEGEPTRAAILGAIDALVATVKPGDFVYLQFGGHGSQQPATSGDESELDGFDEIFLPSDIGAWDGQIGAVQNAIVDNDLQPRILALRKAGAFVFAVFDSCHSGTMLRAVNTEEVDRRLDPAQLGIPQDVLAAAEAEAVLTRGGGKATEESILDIDETADDSGLGGYVAFYAAQTTETTPELRLPAGDPNRQTYGLFSFTLAEVLSANPGITYRQAAQQILADYVADNRNDPTPLFESDGVALDAVLLSGTPAEEIRQWPITPDRGSWRIPAGRLSQIDNGAILAVFADATAAEDATPLGFVAVDNAQIVHSLVQPIAYGDAPAIAEIPEGAFARLVDSQFTVSLTVALPETSDDPTAAPAMAEIERLIADGLDRVAITWVDTGESADLRLHLADGRLWFLPPSGELRRDGDATTTYLTIPAAGDAGALAEFVEGLEANLGKVARVNALFALANQLSATTIGRELTVELGIQRADGSQEMLGIADFPTLYDGDVLTFTVTNTSEQTVDLTALFIDSTYGIEPWFPYQGESNRMHPGETLSSTLEVNLTTTGVERFLFIAAAVQAGAPRADFSFLAQSGMATRSLGVSGLPGATIADILGDAGVELAATRGGGRPVASLATMSAFSWTVAPR
jgi:hypothetical protein